MAAVASRGAKVMSGSNAFQCAGFLAETSKVTLERSCHSEQPLVSGPSTRLRPGRDRAIR